MDLDDAVAFGQWLKRARRARDLTQKALASEIGLSVRTIEKIEIGERRPSRNLVETLAEFFKIPDHERAAFRRMARAIPETKSAFVGGIGPDRDARRPEHRSSNGKAEEMVLLPQSAAQSAPNGDSHPRPATHDPRAHISSTGNLPSLRSAFVDREAEVVELARLLQKPEVRLVTLTGPPGVGKSRLAMRVASELLEGPSYFAPRHGVRYAELASAADSDQMLAAIAGAVQAPESDGRSTVESVEQQLTSKKVLLLLDNFDRVVAAGPLLAEILEACPHVKALVTSREVLRLSIEQEYPVAPLPTPDPATLQSEPGLEGLDRYASILLFVQCARAARPGFSLDAANAGAVARICSRLEGIPLALELAAARLRLFSPQAVLERLESKLALLSGGPRDLPARHQALRNAIEWSYGLLDADEQGLFRRLAVFSGGCALYAIEEVCAPYLSPGRNLLELVTSLVDKSLLHQAGDYRGDTRFNMLNFIREYAWERLETEGEAADVQARHADFYLRSVQQIDREPAAAGRSDQWAELETDRANLLAALEWSAGPSGDAEIASSLVTSLPEEWRAPRGDEHAESEPG